MTKCWDGLDKMPTKNWDGQNANHNKKSLAFCPVGILSAHLLVPQVTVRVVLYHIFEMNERAQVKENDIINHKIEIQLTIWINCSDKVWRFISSRPPFSWCKWPQYPGQKPQKKEYLMLSLIVQSLTTNCEVITQWTDAFLIWNPQEWVPNSIIKSRFGFNIWIVVLIVMSLFADTGILPALVCHGNKAKHNKHDDFLQVQYLDAWYCPHQRFRKWGWGDGKKDLSKGAHIKSCNGCSSRSL